MGMGIRSRGCRQPWPLLLLQLLVLVFFVAPYLEQTFHGARKPRADVDVEALRLRGINLPDLNEISEPLLVRNSLPPRNLDLFPSLADDHIPIVLYVHYRPKYLQLVIQSLSEVIGINETLLIVSHDGFYEDMNAIVESIRFCQARAPSSLLSLYQRSLSNLQIIHDKETVVKNSCWIYIRVFHRENCKTVELT